MGKRKKETNADALYGSLISLSGREYDHDDDGGLPMREDVLEQAIAALTHATGACEALNRTNAAIVVDMHSDGTVTISFSRGDRNLFIDVLCSKVITYVKQFGEGDSEIAGTIRLKDKFPTPGELAEISGLIDWLSGE